MAQATISDVGAFTDSNKTNLNANFTELYNAGGPSNTLLCTTQTDATSNTTLANITGMSTSLATGTYAFTIDLAGTANAAGGWKVAFNYTNSLALSSLEATGMAFAAAAVAVQHTTTTTTQTSLISTTAANLYGSIVGVLVVSTAGTITLQFAQNASNGAASSIFVNSRMTFRKIA